MKRVILILLVLWLPILAPAGEAGLTRTFQPLDGFGNDRILIEPVLCYDWYAASGLPTQIDLISAPNKLPTNAPKPIENVNLASLCGFHFSGDDNDASLTLKLDATQFKKPEEGYPVEDILRASLECLRRVLPMKLLKTPLSFTAPAQEREWMGKIIKEFNAHDRSQTFFAPKA